MKKLLYIIFLLFAWESVWGQNTLIPYYQHGKWGYMDKQTHEISIPPIYDSVADFNTYDKAVVKINNKYGIINTSGKLEIEPTFPYSDKIGDDVYFYNNKVRYQIYDNEISWWPVSGALSEWKIDRGHYTLKSNPQINGYTLIDTSLVVSDTLLFDRLHQLHDSIYFYIKNYGDNIETGIITQNFRKIKVFDDIEQVSKCDKRRFTGSYIAHSRKNGEYTYMILDSNFDIKITSKKDFIYYYQGYYLTGRKIYNSDFKRVFECTDTLYIYDEVITGSKLDDSLAANKLIVFRASNKRCGIINEDGEIILPIKYRSIKRISHNFLEVYDASIDRYAIINNKGQFIKDFVYERSPLITDFFFWGNEESSIKYDFWKLNYILINNYKNCYINIINDTLLGIVGNVDGKNYGFFIIDSTNKIVFSTNRLNSSLENGYYKYMINETSFSRKLQNNWQVAHIGEYVYTINKDGKEYKGVLSSDFKEYIPPKYARVCDITYGDTLFEVQSHDNKIGAYNKDKNIVPVIFDSLSYNFKSLTFIVKKENKYGIYDVHGNEIIPVKYDYILYTPCIFSKSRFANTFVVFKNSKKALFDKDGKQLTDFIFIKLDYYDFYGIFKAENKDSTYYFNKNFEQIYLDSSFKDVEYYYTSKKCQDNRYYQSDDVSDVEVEMKNHGVVYVKIRNWDTLFYNFNSPCEFDFSRYSYTNLVLKRTYNCYTDILCNPINFYYSLYGKNGSLDSLPIINYDELNYNEDFNVIQLNNPVSSGIYFRDWNRYNCNCSIHTKLNEQRTFTIDEIEELKQFAKNNSTIIIFWNGEYFRIIGLNGNYLTQDSYRSVKYFKDKKLFLVERNGIFYYIDTLGFQYYKE